MAIISDSGGLFVAFIIAVTFFVGWIQFVSFIWPFYLSFELRNGLNTQLSTQIWSTSQHCIIYTLGNIFYYFVYTRKWAFFEQDRSSHALWPWESLPKSEWKTLLYNSLFWNLFNSVVTNNLINLSILASGKKDAFEAATDKIPSAGLFAAQCLFCMICEDFAFYISHRVLHSKWLYAKVHKTHHEHQVTFSLAALHAHPLEYAFGNILPVIVGPKILQHRMHRASLFGWFFLRGLESMDGHSGYRFRWSPFRLLPF